MYIKHLAEQLELPGKQTLADRLNIIVGSTLATTFTSHARVRTFRVRIRQGPSFGHLLADHALGRRRKTVFGWSRRTMP